MHNVTVASPMSVISHRSGQSLDQPLWAGGAVFHFWFTCTLYQELLPISETTEVDAGAIKQV